MAIYVITGPMFSGKSTRLIEKYHEYDSRRRAVLVHELDVRYGRDNISTHNGLRLAARAVSKLMTADLLAYLAEFDVIFIDEGCFFADLLELAAWVQTNGKALIVGGLDYTAERKPFGHMLELYEMTDDMHRERLVARCGCGAAAAYTKLVGKVETVDADGVQIGVGGSETYKPSCNDCFNSV